MRGACASRGAGKWMRGCRSRARGVWKCRALIASFGERSHHAELCSSDSSLAELQNNNNNEKR